MWLLGEGLVAELGQPLGRCVGLDHTHPLPRAAGERREQQEAGEEAARQAVRENLDGRVKRRDSGQATNARAAASRRGAPFTCPALMTAVA